MAAGEPQRTELKLDEKYDHYDFPTIPQKPQKGHAGYLTPEQDAQLYQLRSLLEQAGYKERLDTLTLLRFLRARKFNVEHSKQMFIDCEKWRKEFGGGVDKLVKTFDYAEKPEIFKFYPQYYHKTDKDGRPVYIEQLGNVDIPAMNKITSQDRMLQNLVVEYEKIADPRLPACSRKEGHLLETCCTIMDFKGVGLSKANSVYGYVQAASAVSQNYYPERLGKFFIINTPWGFSTVFNFVKRFLDPVTVSKIHVFGSGYQSTLLAQVPAENLPKDFGGTCSCEGGCQFSDDGPWTKDSEWYRPAKWEKELQEEHSVKNEASTGTSGTEGTVPEVKGGDADPTSSTTKDGAAPVAASQSEATKSESIAHGAAPAPA